MAAPAWFQQYHPHAPLTCVAYFCMEFMLSEALPNHYLGVGDGRLFPGGQTAYFRSARHGGGGYAGG
jgi:hypothetical protein